MRIFVTGATGYIGGSVAVRLAQAGHHVVGLVRSEPGAETLRSQGIEPCRGTLADVDVLCREAAVADAIVNAADAKDRAVVDAMLPPLFGTGKTFLQTSGSGVLGDLAAGEPSESVYDEETSFDPAPEMAGRFALDAAVVRAADDGVRSAVLRPSLIYGRGLGANQDSFQVPMLIQQARRSGVVRHVGRGLNVWSNVHIEDLVDLYLLALEKAPAGSLFYAENGEQSMKRMAQAVARMLRLPPPRDWPLADAQREWGPRTPIAMGSNSRVRADRAREVLGWRPHRPDVLHDIEFGSYAAAPVAA